MCVVEQQKMVEGYLHATGEEKMKEKVRRGDCGGRRKGMYHERERKRMSTENSNGFGSRTMVKINKGRGKSMLSKKISVREAVKDKGDQGRKNGEGTCSTLTRRQRQSTELANSPKRAVSTQGNQIRTTTRGASACERPALSLPAEAMPRPL